MLEIILHILAVIGIVLLALLVFILVMAALVLFFPVSYRICGEKDEEKLVAEAKAKWLFGLIRVGYRYPEPGRVIVKVLMFTVYDSKAAAEKKQDEKSVKKSKKPKNGKKSGKKAEKSKSVDAAGNMRAESEEFSGGVAELETGKTGAIEAEANVKEETSDGKGLSFDGKASDSEADTDVREEGNDGKEMSFAGGDGLTSEENAAKTGEDSGKSGQTEGSEASGGRISQKIEKIKYTIHNIYDKIREIWNNISYYMELLKEEDTKRLLSYTIGKLAVILKHLRPKRVRADILFGTGSPDTTGYAYGAYCMLAGVWGSGIVVTPDFERQVFQGRFDARGYITVWILTVNVLKVVLDKRLQAFITKLKAGKGRGSSK